LQITKKAVDIVQDMSHGLFIFGLKKQEQTGTHIESSGAD